MDGDRSPRAHPHRAVTLAAVASNYDRSLIAPLLVVIARDYGESLAAAGLVASAYFASYGTTQWLWALASDALGRRRIIRIALAVAAAAALLAAFAPSLGALALARLIGGAAMSGVVPTALVYLGDTVPAARRHGAVAQLMRGAGFGLALGSAGAAALAAVLGWQSAFVVSGLLSAAVAVMVGGLPEFTPGRRLAVGPAIRGVVGSSRTRLVLGLVFVEGCFLSSLLTLVPAFLQLGEAGLATTGLVSAVFAVTAILGTSLFGRFFDRAPAPASVAVGGAAGCLAFVVVMAGPSVVGVAVVCLLLGVSWVFLHSTLQLWITDVPGTTRAAAVGLFALALFGGQALGVAVGSHVVAEGRLVDLAWVGLLVVAALTLGAVRIATRTGGGAATRGPAGAGAV